MVATIPWMFLVGVAGVSKREFYEAPEGQDAPPRVDFGTDAPPAVGATYTPAPAVPPAAETPQVEAAPPPATPATDPPDDPSEDEPPTPARPRSPRSSGRARTAAPLERAPASRRRVAGARARGARRRAAAAGARGVRAVRDGRRTTPTRRRCARRWRRSAARCGACTRRPTARDRSRTPTRCSWAAATRSGWCAALQETGLAAEIADRVRDGMPYVGSSAGTQRRLPDDPDHQRHADRRAPLADGDRAGAVPGQPALPGRRPERAPTWGRPARSGSCSSSSATTCRWSACARAHGCASLATRRARRRPHRPPVPPRPGAGRSCSRLPAR